jgi:hypothetical protein
VSSQTTSYEDVKKLSTIEIKIFLIFLLVDGTIRIREGHKLIGPFPDPKLDETVDTGVCYIWPSGFEIGEKFSGTIPCTRPDVEK